MTSAIDQCVEFSNGLSLDDVPATVLHEAKRCILDTIGVIIAGSRSPLTDRVRRHALNAHAPGQAVLLVIG